MPTTDITRRRFWILREFGQLYHEFADSLICSSETWFQFDDEVVTRIDFLGEKRYTGKEVVDVLNDSGTTKKCVSSLNVAWLSSCFCPVVRGVSQPRARPAKKRRIDDSDDEIAGYVISPPSSKSPFHFILLVSRTSFRLPPPTEAQVSLPGKAPEGCVMREYRCHMIHSAI